MPTDLPAGYGDEGPDDWIEHDDAFGPEESRSRFGRIAGFVGRADWRIWAFAAAGLTVLAFLLIPGRSPTPVGDEPLPIMVVPPVVPGFAVNPEPVDPDTVTASSVEDRVRAHYMRMPAPYGRSERGEPLPQPSALGKTASGLVLQAPGVPTLFSILAAKAGLPTGEIGFTVPGDNGPRTEPLISQTVAADGTVVSAMPRTLEFLVVAAIVLLGTMVASGIRELIPVQDAHLYRHGFREFVYVGNRLIALAAHFGICSFVVKGSSDLQTVVAIALVLAGAWIHLDMRWRIWKLFSLSALASTVLLFATPVVPSSETLATLYGPAGLYVWDFAGLGVLPALYVLRRLFGGRSSHVVVHAPAPPLVQDVRLVGDRGRR